MKRYKPLFEAEEKEDWEKGQEYEYTPPKKYKQPSITKEMVDFDKINKKIKNNMFTNIIYGTLEGMYNGEDATLSFKKSCRDNNLYGNKAHTLIEKMKIVKLLDQHYKVKIII